MISDFFLQIGLEVVSWVLDLITDDGVGSVTWVVGFAGILAQVLSGVVGLGAWVPWLLVVGVVGSIFTLWGVLGLVKFVAWLKSLFWAGS